MANDYRRSGMYARRRRRTLWWWFIPVVVVIAGSALLVNSRGTETRRETAFFDATRTLSQEVDQVAAGFGRLVSTELRTVARDDFEVLMDRLGSQMTRHADGLTEVETPDSARAAREMLDLAFGSWAAGLAEFRTAITEVVDDPTRYGARGPAGGRHRAAPGRRSDLYPFSESGERDDPRFGCDHRRVS